MNKTLRFILIVVTVVIGGVGLLFAGALIGQSALGLAGFWPTKNLPQFTSNQLDTSRQNFGFMPESSLKGSNRQGYSEDAPAAYNYSMGAGMMGRSTTDYYDRENPEGALTDCGYGWGPGMMGGGMMGYYNENYSEDDLTSCDIEWGAGMMGGGMMEWGYTGSTNADPLTLDQAHDAVEEFLADLNNSDLELGEVMIFDNHAYAQIVEESTGIGALEVLVDPVTLAVYPELGPNMMLNLKYGMMSGFSGSSFGGHGMMGGGMMGGFGFPGRSNYLPANISDEMPVSPEQAVEAAQDYLDSYLPDYQADEYADPFYGYYTLHTLKDGEVVGMLSVNGFSGQVFLHTWHGELLEMTSGHD